MAGKKQKKKSKSAEAKLPKRIAGVKVPKELRAPAGRLVAAVNDPILLDLAAATLTAAATRFADGLANKPARSEPPAHKNGLSVDVGAMALLALSEGLKRMSEPPAAKRRGAQENGATKPPA